MTRHALNTCLSSDLLRTAVAEAICPSPERRAGFPEAVVAIKSEMTIDAYCKRIQSPSFWGGESELLVLSTMLKQPIRVYLPAAGGGLGYRPLVTYGSQFEVVKSTGKKRAPVKLLYSNGNQCVAPALVPLDDAGARRSTADARVAACAATTCCCERRIRLDT